MKRKLLKRRADRAYFSRTANTTRQANIIINGMRGGTRL